MRCCLLVLLNLWGRQHVVSVCVPPFKTSGERDIVIPAQPLLLVILSGAKGLEDAVLISSDMTSWYPLLAS